MNTEIKINADGGGERLDAYLTSVLESVSRSSIQKLIKSGDILLNGSAAKPHTELRNGDVVCVSETPGGEKDGPLVPRDDIAPDIVHQDESIIVVNKPSGLLTHPDVPGESETLANALIARFPEIAEVGESPDRPGIVHRLDREASGLLVMAKTQDAYGSLKSQFKNHEVEKEYLVLVSGAPPEDSGTITLPIGRMKGTGKMAARHEKKPGDRSAVTHYRVVERFRDATLLSVRTETGRTHQIRVHMKSLGTPVAGDALYAIKRAKAIRTPRLFLHAARLSFTHPGTKVKAEFTSPLPDELNEVLDRLKSRP